MKRKIFYVLAVAFLSSNISSAKIWRVNNHSGIDADYTTIQDAHDGATAGDTIMVEPSSTAYGTLTCTKQLVILGIGYFLTENYPNLSIAQNSSFNSNTLTFETGSEGSYIAGLSDVEISLKASDIIIERCNDIIFDFYNSTMSLSNILISKCFKLEFQNTSYVNDLQGLVISNSYIYQTYYSSQTFDIDFSCVFQNNVIDASQSYYSITIKGQALINNILTSTNLTLENCSMSNNFDASGVVNFIFGTDNGNQGGYTTNNIFVTEGSTDGLFTLKTGSPAIGSGLDDVDCGMFGGDDPYVLSGVPPIPLITKFVKPGVASDNTPLKVTLSIQSTK